VASSQINLIKPYLNIIYFIDFFTLMCKQFIGMRYCSIQMHDSEDFSKDHKEGNKKNRNKVGNKELEVEKVDEMDHELEKLRLKRMESLLRQQQEKTQKISNTPTHEDKIRMVLQVIMTPDAYEYYCGIEHRDKAVFQRIQQIILPPEVMQQLDLLIAYMSRGMLRSNIIDIIQIQQLERRILGVGPKITVKKRDGDSTDLNSFLKNNK